MRCASSRAFQVGKRETIVLVDMQVVGDVHVEN